MIEGLPAGVRARPATRADLLSVVDLFLSYDATLQAEPDPLNEYLAWIWGLPHVDLARDTVLLEAEDAVIGFAQGVRDPDTGGPFSVDWGVAPAHDLDTVGGTLLTWCERQRDDREIADPIRTSIVAEDDRARALLERRGYVQVRLMWDMVRALGELHDLDVELPDGVEVRPFRVGQDEQLLYRLDETAFRDHWDHVDRTYEAFAAMMFGVSWEPSLAFLAEVDGEPAGELVAIADEGRGFIASVGVLRAFRGRGAAKALLRRAFAELAARGHERVELSVDATSPTGAVALYEGLGMHVARRYAIFDGPAG
ncbi:MAG TPA: GNAT family N-acetyltransferase [Actinomycetota bacterium]|nr:GNAT family N-acetyltransferase [Actinomycetota bacterium]